MCSIVYLTLSRIHPSTRSGYGKGKEREWNPVDCKVRSLYILKDGDVEAGYKE